MPYPAEKTKKRKKPVHNKKLKSIDPNIRKMKAMTEITKILIEKYKNNEKIVFRDVRDYPSLKLVNFMDRSRRKYQQNMLFRTCQRSSISFLQFRRNGRNSYSQ